MFKLTLRELWMIILLKMVQKLMFCGFVIIIKNFTAGGLGRPTHLFHPGLFLVLGCYFLKHQGCFGWDNYIPKFSIQYYTSQCVKILFEIYSYYTYWCPFTVDHWKKKCILILKEYHNRDMSNIKSKKQKHLGWHREAKNSECEKILNCIDSPRPD